MKDHPIFIVTGLSGSGKSLALATLEDLGYLCVDNLPVALLRGFLALPAAGGAEGAGCALGMDLRDKDFLAAFGPVLAELRREGFRFEILFLEAEDAVLVRRYSATRRRHPLVKGLGLAEAIAQERRWLAPLRQAADRVIDSSRLNVHELKARIIEIARSHRELAPMQINVISFGYKYGTPPEADILLDVRFLANPYFVPELKDGHGEAAEVRDYVLNNAEAQEFLVKTMALLEFLIPLYEREGKTGLNLAVGCTGGRHRSVSMARALFERLSALRRGVELMHRDMDRPQGHSEGGS